MGDAGLVWRKWGEENQSGFAWGRWRPPSPAYVRACDRHGLSGLRVLATQGSAESLECLGNSQADSQADPVPPSELRCFKYLGQCPIYGHGVLGPNIGIKAVDGCCQFLSKCPALAADVVTTQAVVKNEFIALGCEGGLPCVWCLPIPFCGTTDDKKHSWVTYVPVKIPHEIGRIVWDIDNHEVDRLA
jgi:hypothetical protein